MPIDETEQTRRQMVAEMPEELVAVVAAGLPVWNTTEMQAEFEAIGFMAPFLVVRRKSDGVTGSLQFAHSPRFYFNFMEDKR